MGASEPTASPAQLLMNVMSFSVFPTPLICCCQVTAVETAGATVAGPGTAETGAPPPGSASAAEIVSAITAIGATAASLMLASRRAVARRASRSEMRVKT
jgi:hypothetical protein